MLDTWRGDKKPHGVKAFIGWAGLSVTDESVDVLDLLRAYMKRASQESCGQCFPCREGLRKISEILERMCDGEGRDNDKEQLASLAELVYNSARCDIGQTSPRPLMDVLAHAPEVLTPRVVPPKSYTATVTAPCINDCPTHVDIPDYLEKIRFRLFDEAMISVMRRCPMPGTIGRVCVRPCEEKCKRGLTDSPIAIKHLKRFVADQHLKKHGNPIPQKPNRTGTRIAIIGAGPAGLSCAYFLARQGFSPTIFEAQEMAGGMAKYGIPDYRLPPEVMSLEVDRVRQAGCDIHYGVEVGVDISLNELEEQGYEAVFIGAGAQRAAKMWCEGEDELYDGFMSGVEYLGLAARGVQGVHGKCAVVVGGGNVAMDCVRTALRQGFTEVHLVYRRTISEMPADHQEIEEAQEEGVIFDFLMAPLKIKGEKGKVTGLVCQKMELGEPDESGRRKPVPVENGIVEIPCDAVITAIGQAVELERLAGKDKLTEKKRYLQANEVTGQVGGSTFLFGGGDCVTGPSTLVAALAAGRRAAEHIIEAFSGKPISYTNEEKMDAILADIGVSGGCEEVPWKGYTKTLPIKCKDPAFRITGFMEVEEGAIPSQAIDEASRCLRCYRIAMAEF